VQNSDFLIYKHVVHIITCILSRVRNVHTLSPLSFLFHEAQRSDERRDKRQERIGKERTEEKREEEIHLLTMKDVAIETSESIVREV
jgi:hypothetical protein